MPLEKDSDNSCTIDSSTISVGNLPFWRCPIFKATLLFIFTLLLYWPSYHAGFILDDEMMAANPLYKEGWRGLRDIWCSTRFGDFVPVTATSFWLEWQAYGSPHEIQHTTNILLQALNVVLLWQVLRRLKVPGAWLAAAVFAAHPLCVTSVTWLAERKNTLSMFFYLLSLLFYLRSETAEDSPSEKSLLESGGSSLTTSQRRLFYWFSFTLFLLALLSKSSVVVLPMVILLCAWWLRGQVSSRDLKRTAPFFFVAFAIGVATLVAHYIYGPKMGVNSTTDSLLIRTLSGSRAVWFYFGKELLPTDLTLLYPRWEIDSSSPLAYLPGAAILGLFILFWCCRRSWGRVCLFGFGYFILALAPSLGVLKMSFLAMAQVADHFQYLALPGMIALLIGGAYHLLRQITRNTQVISAFLLLILVPPFAWLSWQHQKLVANPVALWQQNVERNPNCWTAHNNLGQILGNQGKLDDALPHLLEAVRLKPDLVPAHYNLGRLYLLKGNLSEAIQSFSNTIAIDPKNFAVQLALADALSKHGDGTAAAHHSAVAHCHQATALLREGKAAAAIAQWNEALRSDPNSIEAMDNLAWSLATMKDNKLRNGTDAVQFAERLYAMGGSNVPPILDTLAAAYAETGKFSEATNTIQKAIALAETSGKTNAATKYRTRLKIYREGRPYRE